jgi:N-acetylmuramoyl-L-alanine amidase
MRRFRVSGKVTDFIAWFGLALMACSFLILVLKSARLSQRNFLPNHKKTEPFALVILDPGHGGHDSGAIAGNVSEKDLTFDIAQRLNRILSAESISTLLTRTGDSYVSLSDRTQLINRAKDAIVVSIHFNDGPRPEVSGIETYFAAQQAPAGTTMASWLPFLQKITSTESNLESQSLAQFIQLQLVAHTQAVNRGTKAQQFYVLANVRHPAVLVEGGFLTNRNEIGKLADAKYREQLAVAISAGILKYRETIKKTAEAVNAEPYP